MGGLDLVILCMAGESKTCVADVYAMGCRLRIHIGILIPTTGRRGSEDLILCSIEFFRSGLVPSNKRRNPTMKPETLVITHAHVRTSVTTTTSAHGA